METVARLLGTYAPGTPAWHAARHHRIGGSEIASALGWGRWETREQMLARKLAPPPEHDEPTPAMLRGTLLEPAILAWGTEARGYQYDPDVSAGTWLHTRFDWALYNPDGVTTDGLLIECKTTTDRHRDQGWGRAGTDQIPRYYRAQVTWGMGILGLPEARVLVLDGAHNGRPSLAFSEYRVRFDRPLFTRLLAGGLRFHNDLAAALTRAA